jgi:hypothetical protein
VGGESADGGGGAGGLAGAINTQRGGTHRSRGYGAEAEAVGRDDAVVEDVVNVGLSGEAAEGGGVAFRGSGFDGCDAEMFVAAGKMGSS